MGVGGQQSAEKNTAYEVDFDLPNVVEYCALPGVDLDDQLGRENMVGSKQVLCVSCNHSSHLQSKGIGAQPPHSNGFKWTINQAVLVNGVGKLHPQKWAIKLANKC